MTAEVLPFPATETDPLAALYAERDAVEAEFARFQKVDEARLSAERDLAASGRRAGRDRLRPKKPPGRALGDYAARGPTPVAAHSRAREALARKRVAAAASLASAVNGAKAVEPRQLALNADFRRISDEIFAEKVRVALTCRGGRLAHKPPARRRRPCWPAPSGLTQFGTHCSPAEPRQ